ncbi:hypothetical protein BKA81DRAFT_190363 [Phyllosticta paracitricarpa]
MAGGTEPVVRQTGFHQERKLEEEKSRIVVVVSSECIGRRCLLSSLLQPSIYLDRRRSQQKGKKAERKHSKSEQHANNQTSPIQSSKSFTSVRPSVRLSVGLLNPSRASSQHLSLFLFGPFLSALFCSAQLGSAAASPLCIHPSIHPAFFDLHSMRLSQAPRMDLTDWTILNCIWGQMES